MITLFKKITIKECAEALGAIATNECNVILEEYAKDSEVGST